MHELRTPATHWPLIWRAFRKVEYTFGAAAARRSRSGLVTTWSRQGRGRPSNNSDSAANDGGSYNAAPGRKAASSAVVNDLYIINLPQAVFFDERDVEHLFAEQ